MQTPVPHHILVVDDDPEIRTLLAAYLAKQGYRASAVADGRGLWSSLRAGAVDLVVLDLMLPGEDGLALCRRLRAESELPILMLTARGEETDRIVGLELGADDYLAKPFNPRELVARIRSILRRSSGEQRTRDDSEPARMRFAGWTLDLVSRDLIGSDGVLTPLSGTEFRLLRAFAAHPQRVLNRDRLMNLTRGRNEVGPFDRSIDVQVSRLRQRLRDDAREPAIIKTVRGEGYLLAATVAVEHDRLPA